MLFLQIWEVLKAVKMFQKPFHVLPDGFSKMFQNPFNRETAGKIR
jgi:hypothetical protein